MPEVENGQLGLMACLSFVVGNIIGSGIFIIPGIALALSGSIGLDLIIWTACGIVTFLGGIVFIELGTAIPSDGGDFAYSMFVGWESLAFSFMAISCFVSYPGSSAIQANIFGQYLVVGFAPLWDPRSFTTAVEWILGASLLVICTFVNLFPVGKGTSTFQVAAVYAKAVILITVIGFGEHQNIEDPFKGSILEPGAIALACYSSLWSFAGWDILNAGAPSVKNPRRTLPLALLGGLIFVTIIYLLTNISFCAVLGVAEMKASKAVAADFARKCMGSLSHAVPIATALLLLSTMNGCVFALSRIMAKAAEEGHLPKFLSARHKTYNTPVAALLTQLILSLLFTAFNVNTIINYVSVVMWGQKTLSVAALLKIRYYDMEVNSEVLRVPLLIIIVFCIVSITLTFLPAYAETEMFLVGSVAVIFLAGVYFTLYRLKKPEWMKTCDDKFAQLTCAWLYSEIPEKEQTIDRRDTRTEILEEEHLLPQQP